MGDDWRRYPFELVPGDPHFVFPAAEANHPTCESDTWFLAGELTGETDRKFAFLTIFNKNRPGQAIVADFYTLALFDLDNGTYGTFTDYDMPSTNKKSDVRPKLTMRRRPPGHDVRQPRRHRGLAYLPRRGGRADALHVRRDLLRHRPARRRRCDWTCT